MSATSWTFGPNGVYTATWGVAPVTSGTPGTPQGTGAAANPQAAPAIVVTLTATGAAVAGYTGDLLQQATAQGAVSAMAPVTPGDAGFLAWTFDPYITGNSSTPGAGAVNLARINIRQAITVTNVSVAIGVVGSGLTSGQNFAGLYAGETTGPYTAGQLIGTSADQTTPWGSTGLKTAALASGPFAIPGGTFVWVAFMTNFSTTAPSFARGASQPAAFVNAGFAAATARSATNGTGTTALPSPIVPGSNSLAGTAFWAALS